MKNHRKMRVCYDYDNQTDDATGISELGDKKEKWGVNAGPCPQERVGKGLKNSRQSSQEGESITDVRRGSSQSTMQGSAFLCCLPFCLFSPWLPQPSPIQNDSEALMRGFLPTLESSFKHNVAPTLRLCFKLQPGSWAFECQQLRRQFYV